VASIFELDDLDVGDLSASFTDAPSLESSVHLFDVLLHRLTQLFVCIIRQRPTLIPDQVRPLFSNPRTPYCQRSCLNASTSTQVARQSSSLYSRMRLRIETSPVSTHEGNRGTHTPSLTRSAQDSGSVASGLVLSSLLLQKPLHRFDHVGLAIKEAVVAGVVELDNHDIGDLRTGALDAPSFESSVYLFDVFLHRPT